MEIPLIIDYDYADKLAEEGITLVAERKSNSTRGHTLENGVNLRKHRKTIEGTFSLITNWLSKKLHAVTARGVEIKTISLVITAAIEFYLN